MRLFNRLSRRQDVPGYVPLEATRSQPLDDVKEFERAVRDAARRLEQAGVPADAVAEVLPMSVDRSNVRARFPVWVTTSTTHSGGSAGYDYTTTVALAANGVIVEGKLDPARKALVVRSDQKDYSAQPVRQYARKGILEVLRRRFPQALS